MQLDKSKKAQQIRRGSRNIDEVKIKNWITEAVARMVTVNGLQKQIHDINKTIEEIEGDIDNETEQKV